MRLGNILMIENGTDDLINRLEAVFCKKNSLPPEYSDTPSYEFCYHIKSLIEEARESNETW